MKAITRMEIWKWIGWLSVLWLVLAYFIMSSLEEGSTPVRIVILSMLIPIILIPIAIHFYKIAKSESLNMTLDEYNKTKREENERFRQEYLDSKKPKFDENGKIMCPKCGSSNIQVLNKKWSATTGFMTNKIDRVCINCKHRF